MRSYGRNGNLLWAARRDDACAPRHAEGKRFGMHRSERARPARIMGLDAFRRSRGTRGRAARLRGLEGCLLVHAGRSGRYCRCRRGRGNCRTREQKNKHENGEQASRPRPQRAEWTELVLQAHGRSIGDSDEDISFGEGSRAGRRHRCGDVRRPAGAGAIIGFLGIACPVCNKVLVLLIGSALLLEYFEPVRLYVALAGAVLLAAAVWIKSALPECLKVV